MIKINRRNTVIAIFASFLLFAGCDKASAKGFTKISVDEAHVLMSENKEMYVLDVRTPEEHAAGHIKGTNALSNWHDWKNAFMNLKPAPAIDQPLLVYCRSGTRSNAAAEWLSSHGFTQVYDLAGGFSAWSSAGKPTNK